MPTLLEIIDRAVATNATTLDLSGMNLTELPPEIGKLTHLKTLILGRQGYDEGSRSEKLTNNLTTLPPEIGNLTQLERLKIWNNCLIKLPPEIGQLQNLKWLDLSENRLKALPPEIGELKKLGLLNLSNNQLNQLPVEIAQLQNLRSLNLGDNQLTELPPQFSQLVNLRSLNLWNNQLTELPPQFSQLVNLRSLNLWNNQLTELPPQFSQLVNLRSLNLSGNELTELPPQFSQLVNLRLLNFWNNQLTELPPQFSQLVNLRSLNLGGNQLTELPPQFSQLVNLRSLDLWNNQLTELPPQFLQLVNLRSLDLWSNQLTELPPQFLQLVNLRSLNLWNNQLTELPPQFSQLVNLRSLDLWNNQLTELPPQFSQLVNLRFLNLWNNQLTELPPQFSQLVNLRSLNLGSNQLTELPPQFSQLVNLRSLNLSSNQLTELPPQFSQLVNLRSLNLSGKELTKLPSHISQLVNLRSLDLWNNQLTELPPKFSQLVNLRSLFFRGSQLTELPPQFSQLVNLRSLDLSSNELSQLPPEITQLQNLQSLDLSSNELSQLPPEITQLQNLRSLDLSSNQFNTLPIQVIQLVNLEELNLQNNQLSQLPSEIQQLVRLNKLDLRGNPLPIPPEILGPENKYANPGDVHEILEFYFRVQDPNESELLYEAKFLIVGEGGAGKTSLAKKIEKESYELKPEEKSTEGIEVIRWNFPLPNGHEFRVNIWDFGGQEIYHQTHQFFLTERSLYALVADTRQDNTDFYYWLKVIELLSDNSPVFIIKNEKQDRQCVVNERQLRGEFTNLKEVLATNLATKRGLTEIKDAIQQYISKLPHVGTPLPKLWVRVRLAIENDSRNTLSLPEYYELCRINRLTDQTDMLRLSRYLHDLGVCLHFQDDPVLKYTVILKPEWGTTAVYKVLDNDTVIKNLGCFTQDDLKEIWQDSKYADKRDELLRLMMRFKLCYEIPGRSNVYIAPQLLTIDQPDYAWDDFNNLTLRYEYEFMPKGILTRLIVEMHPWIEEQKLVWRSGVVLLKDQTRAEVVEHYSQREIRVKVSGSRKKELLAVVTHEIDKIHQSFERLKFRKLIPCNCDVCKGNPKPYCYDFERLKQFLDRRQYQIMCYESGQDVEVRQLIDDVLLPSEFLTSPLNPPQVGDFGEPVPPKVGGLGGLGELGGRVQNPLQQDLDREREAILARATQLQKPISKPMRDLVFISYSHKDKKWFEDLKQHLEPLVREQNLKLWDDTQIKPGAVWFDEIQKALAATKVAVLLVTPGFLASDFIAKNELPPLLDAVKAEGVQILWIPVRASNYEATAIEKYQAAHPTDKPLSGISTARRDRAWVEICQKIKAAANGA
ncbi:leucine-rich repeat domain-containing protein [Oscillatoria sp. FACHB-1407]|uniref:leucine-rich repeat domain-containing protein n=1 Tax=Oscillatoria sp. FACHB-1407 TaxID=2692847 RepID=UPI0016872452|nr:leucine-rich repeat domain-containing protein [Oscillatoria sp. FACHB-1407]MBD2459869.1 leucine-rich repeat domain-containing protein [Oscillatoria sp. FACHB-1407]